MDTISYASALIAILDSNGIRTVFANPGTTEMPLVKAIDSNCRFNSILCLHENVATGAADGFNRVSGNVAVALLHLGPGLSNGLSNLHNAKRASSKLIVLVGTFSPEHSAQNPPLEMDIQTLASTVSGSCIKLSEGKDIMCQLMPILQHENSAMHIILFPHHVQSKIYPFAIPSAPPPTFPILPAQQADPLQRSLAKEVAENLINNSCAIIFGCQLLTNLSSVFDDVQAICKKHGDAIFCKNNFSAIDRGKDNLYLQRLPYFPWDVKKELSSYNKVYCIGTSPPVDNFEYVDEPIDTTSYKSPNFHTISSCSRLLFEVAELCMHESKALNGRTSGYVSAKRVPFERDEILTANTMCEVVATHQPAGCIVVDESLTSGTTYWSVSTNSPAFTHVSLTGGAIGIGPPCALGASIAHPCKTVINIEGDGSCMYSVPALWSQAQKKCQIITVLCKNSEYAILEIEGRLQHLKLERNNQSLTNLRSPDIDWVKIASGLGVNAHECSTNHEFEKIMIEALRHEGPTLIQANISKPAEAGIMKSKQRCMKSSMTMKAKASTSLQGEVIVTSDNVLAGKAKDYLKEIRNHTLDISKFLHPDSEETAIVKKNHHISHKEMYKKCVELSKVILSRGLPNIALCCMNSIDVILLHFATSLAGGCLINLNPRLTPSEMSYQISTTSPKIIFSDLDRADTVVQSVGLCQVQPNEVLILDDDGFECPAETPVICRPLSRALLDSFVDSKSVLRSKDDFYQLYFTSGTTGVPKAVALTREQIALHALAAGMVEMKMSSIDRWGHFAPMYHAVDAFAIYSITFVQGVHVIPDETAFSPQNILITIQERRVTCTNFASTMVALMVETSGIYDLSSLRIISCGGSPLSRKHVQAALNKFQCEFFCSYGMTECCGKIAMSLVPAEHSQNIDLIASSGRPFCILDVSVVGIDTHAPIAADQSEVGEVRIRGETVCKGYLNDADANRDNFRDGWFHTGDLAHVNSFGYLYVIDRVKDMILSAGENVYCVEVENALKSHPNINEAVVYGLPHEDLGEIVKAVIVAKGDMNAHDITRFCRERLAAYKIPSVIQFENMDNLPISANHKIMKSKLRQLDLKKYEEQHQDRAPPSRREADNQDHMGTIIRIWKGVLDVENIDEDSEFLSLGGDSLGASQVSSLLEAEYKVRIPLPILYQSRTPRELADGIAGLIANTLPHNSNDDRPLQGSTPHNMDSININRLQNDLQSLVVGRSRLMKMCSDFVQIPAVDLANCFAERRSPDADTVRIGNEITSRSAMKQLQASIAYHMRSWWTGMTWIIGLPPPLNVDCFYINCNLDRQKPVTLVLEPYECRLFGEALCTSCKLPALKDQRATVIGALEQLLTANPILGGMACYHDGSFGIEYGTNAHGFKFFTKTADVRADSISNDAELHSKLFPYGSFPHLRANPRSTGTDIFWATLIQCTDCTLLCLYADHVLIDLGELIEILDDTVSLCLGNTEIDLKRNFDRNMHEEERMLLLNDAADQSLSTYGRHQSFQFEEITNALESTRLIFTLIFVCINCIFSVYSIAMMLADVIKTPLNVWPAFYLGRYRRENNFFQISSNALEHLASETQHTPFQLLYAIIWKACASISPSDRMFLFNEFDLKTLFPSVSANYAGSTGIVTTTHCGRLDILSKDLGDICAVIAEANSREGARHAALSWTKIAQTYNRHARAFKCGHQLTDMLGGLGTLHATPFNRNVKGSATVFIANNVIYGGRSGAAPLYIKSPRYGRREVFITLLADPAHADRITVCVQSLKAEACAIYAALRCIAIEK